MSPVQGVQPIRLLPVSKIRSEVDAFLVDRQARGLSKRTVEWYREQLWPFAVYATSHGVTQVTQITPDLIRRYLVDMGKAHNEGGVHGRYRAVRAFLNWWVAEIEPQDWKNPMLKVAPPRMPQKLLEPMNLDDLRVMLRTCKRKEHTGDRDRALLMFLLDSGCRRAEVCALNLEDVDLHTGGVLVRRGKGGKFRTVFMGNRTRRAVIAYLRHRPEATPLSPLWASINGERLSFTALRAIVQRRAKRAGVHAPSLHAFRRGFALACLRAGVDIYSLQKLMGHSDLSILRRYLAQTEGDLQDAHQKGGPVDHAL